MKAVTVKKLKDELGHKSSQELIVICLQLSKFKKENKELLTYILFEADNEEGYIESVKEQIDDLFDKINTKSYFYIRKSVRKILTITKKFIKYSKNTATEVELLLYFCEKLRDFKPSINQSPRLISTYDRQLLMAKNAIGKLHEDLQFDFNDKITDLDL